MISKQAFFIVNISFSLLLFFYLQIDQMSYIEKCHQENLNFHNITCQFYVTCHKYMNFFQNLYLNFMLINFTCTKS